MTTGRRLISAGFACLVFAAVVALSAQDKSKDKDSGDKEKEKRPKLTLTARPPIAMSPARVSLTAELAGGPDDLEDFYCPTIEWDWGDGTSSETTSDCDPYEAGKSEIKRRFVMEHTFRSISSSDMPGAAGLPTGPTQFRVRFVLKQKNKVVGSGQTVVEIRSGMGEEESLK